MSLNYYFCSSIPISYKEEIENLFYFNINQSIFLREIEKIVELYGNPKLIPKYQRFTIELENTEGSQNLFLLSDKPPTGKIIAVLIHKRNMNSADVIHISINEEYTIENNNNNDTALFILLKELKRIYHQIKGVKEINILYTHTKIRIT